MLTIIQLLPKMQTLTKKEFSYENNQEKSYLLPLSLFLVFLFSQLFPCELLKKKILY